MGVLKVALRELRYIKGNKRMLFVMCGMPFLLILLFGIMYSPHVVKNIKTAVLDYNNTASSRAIVQGFKDSEKFQVISQVNNEVELKRMMENREVITGIVIPEDLDAKLKTNEGTTVLVVVNGTNMLFSNAVQSAANEIVGTYSAGASIKSMESSENLLPGIATPTAQPIRYAIRVWYNPTFNYTNFLLLGLAGTTIQQIILLYVAVSLAREKALGTIKELVSYSALQVVFGKLLVYLVINILSANLVYYLCFAYFHIPFHGSIWTFELLLIAFFLAVTAIGVMLSIICHNELEATQIAMLVAVPSFLVSGFTWPIQSMPHGIQIFSSVLPLTYFVTEVRDLALMGISLEQVMPSIYTLLKMTGILLPAAIFLVHCQFKKENAQILQENGN